MTGYLKRILAATYLVVLSALPASAHDIHATMTEVLWNERDQSLELVVEMHAELLEARLSIELGERLSFLEEQHFDVLQSATAPLLEEHLYLSEGEAPINLTYLGLEYRDDHVYLYLETEMSEAPKTLTVMNSLFLDDLPGQINTVVAKVGEKMEAGQITVSSDPVIFRFP
ncbi:MAG: hypothetical protein HWE25_09920 [Alphaproteobacteria bacterium]|nr:hypothetical protein [Alphaproteobacteria bacterium]